MTTFGPPRAWTFFAALVSIKSPGWKERSGSACEKQARERRRLSSSLVSRGTLSCSESTWFFGATRSRIRIQLGASSSAGHVEPGVRSARHEQSAREDRFAEPRFAVSGPCSIGIDAHRPDARRRIRASARADELRPTAGRWLARSIAPSRVVPLRVRLDGSAFDLARLRVRIARISSDHCFSSGASF